jgi:hypothetical protein
LTLGTHPCDSLARVSASVSGPEPRDGSTHASTRRLSGVLAIAVTLITACAAAPAWGQDAGGGPPAPPGAGAAPPPPPPVPPAPAAPTSSSGSAPAPPSPPPVPAVPPVERRSGAEASRPASGDTITLADAKPRRGSRVYSTEGMTTTIELPANGAGRGKNAQVSPNAEPVHGSLGGSPRYKPGRRDGRGSAARLHANAKISSRGGAPGVGSPLPGRSPSVSLLRSTGGAAGLALAGVLAVLGAAIVVRRDRARIFRMPTVTWRPLAYVPPIDLPG